MPDKAVLSFLEDKYSEDFQVVSTDYIAETGNYDIRISPKGNPDLVFKVDHNPKKDHFNDYYPYAIWQFDADKAIRAILDEQNVPYALLTNVSALVEFEPDNIPKFEDLLESNKDKVSVNLKLHFFGDLNAETLSAQQKLDEHFRKMNLKKVGFSSSIYNTASIDGKELSDLNFDFGVHSENTFESENTDHFLGLIKYRIDSKKDAVPSSESLLDIVVDNPKHMMFKKL
ncbi:hypothetical protein N9B82_06545 [Saprospiraceae bacterium]|nr:hypothetical protein [Saprospiraceae bacterium]